MILSEKGIKFIKDREGLRLKAYLDSAGVPTIGYGTTRYENGQKVKLGEVVTHERAEELLLHDVATFQNHVARLVKVPLKPQQFDALVSLCYNIGTAGFAGSTVLRRVNADPDDPTIADAFRMWNKITVTQNGQRVKVVSAGLAVRRNLEVKLYFS